MSLTLSVVIIDDEPLSRARIRDLLADLPWVTVVGEAPDGERGLSLIGATRPDVALLDIQMPSLSGLDVLRRASPRPYAIFTTAYDQFAIEAFELNAIDYLLKPFGAARLRAALERARQHLATGHHLDQLERLADSLTSGAAARLDRVFVNERGRVVPVTLAEVERLQAERDYVALYVGAKAHLLRVRLTDLLGRLNPADFVRVHRSHAINLARLSQCETLDDSRLALTLASGARVIASRAGSRELRRRLRYDASGDPCVPPESS